jgi:hypothetical protein
MKLVRQRLNQCQMKRQQLRVSHSFDLITLHLSEIAKQLIRQTKRKEPQGQQTCLT